MTLALGSQDATLIATTTNAVLSTETGQQLMLIKVSAANTDTSARTVTVWRVPPGGVTGSGNVLLEPYSIAANSTAVLPLSGQTFVNGQGLFASASVANVVNLNIGYATL